MSAHVNMALFFATALLWGSTWAAVRIGLQGLPPIFLAGMRYVITALVLLVAVRGWVGIYATPKWKRVVVTGLMVNTGTYGLLFWGVQSVPTGVSGLINFSVVPVSLYLLAICTGETRLSLRHLCVLALGILGLAALFWNRLYGESTGQVAGLVAIVVGSLFYSGGSMLSRPLLEDLKPLQLVGAQAPIGAAGLIIWSFLAEHPDMQTVAALASLPAISSLAFLVFGGTIAAYAIYLRLMRDWGATYAGMYAFISPVVALSIGNIAFGEIIGAPEIVGTILLLVAAGVAPRGRHVDSRKRVRAEARAL